MARARRTNSRDTPTPPKRSTRAIGGICPVCGELLGDQLMEAHLEGHKPTGACAHCGKEATEWTLDWDEVDHPHRGCGLFHCKNCGIFAPLTGEEIQPAPVSNQ